MYRHTRAWGLRPLGRTENLQGGLGEGEEVLHECSYRIRQRAKAQLCRVELLDHRQDPE